MNSTHSQSGLSRRQFLINSAAATAFLARRRKPRPKPPRRKPRPPNRPPPLVNMVAVTIP